MALYTMAFVIKLSKRLMDSNRFWGKKKSSKFLDFLSWLDSYTYARERDRERESESERERDRERVKGRGID